MTIEYIEFLLYILDFEYFMYKYWYQIISFWKNVTRVFTFRYSIYKGT